MVYVTGIRKLACRSIAAPNEALLSATPLEEAGDSEDRFALSLQFPPPELVSYANRADAARRWQDSFRLALSFEFQKGGPPPVLEHRRQP